MIVDALCCYYLNHLSLKYLILFLHSLFVCFYLLLIWLLLYNFSLFFIFCFFWLFRPAQRSFRLAVLKDIKLKWSMSALTEHIALLYFVCISVSFPVFSSDFHCPRFRPYRLINLNGKWKFLSRTVQTWQQTTKRDKTLQKNLKRDCGQ